MPLIFLSSASSLTREERFYPLNFPPGHLHTLRTKQEDGRGRNLLVFFLSLSLVSPIFFTFLLFISSFSLLTFSFPLTHHHWGHVEFVWNYPTQICSRIDFCRLHQLAATNESLHAYWSLKSLNHLLNAFKKLFMTKLKICN